MSNNYIFTAFISFQPVLYNVFVVDVLLPCECIGKKIYTVPQLHTSNRRHYIRPLVQPIFTTNLFECEWKYKSIKRGYF